VDRFRANLGATGHRVLENASVHSTVGAIIDPGTRVIIGLDSIAKMLKNSEAPHSLWIGSAANLTVIGVPVDAPGLSDQSIAATRDFLMKPSEAVGKALSPSSSTDTRCRLLVLLLLLHTRCCTRISLLIATISPVVTDF
jgi:hypothetical protein